MLSKIQDVIDYRNKPGRFLQLKGHTSW